MLVDGRWSKDWRPTDEDGNGAFRRKPSTFRNWITPDGLPGPTGDGGFSAEAGRYHLYAALICPWACRTLMVRELKGLEPLVDVSIVDPRMTDQGWRFGDFPGSIPDPLFASTYMHELYTRADPQFTGRATVPLLWDKKRGTAVNNESADIIRMFGSAFEALAPAALDLYPADLAPEIDALAQDMYDQLNNGVYRTGFATIQAVYEAAVTDVFAMLDTLEARLGPEGFLFGERLTEADVRLFVTLIRFDVAYHGAFKCNIRRIADYPRLQAYLGRVLAVDGIAQTVDISHIKTGYYSIKTVNPTRIVPLGPAPTLSGLN